MHGSPLLEREELLDLMASHVTAAAEGRGRILFLGAEAGGGKTALIEHFAAALPRGASVMIGGCEPMAAPIPLGAVFDIAEAIGNDFSAMLDSPNDRRQIFAHLLATLQQARELTVIVFEDLHWADDATLDLLRFLGRRIGTARALLVCSYRDDEVGTRHPTRQLLGDLAHATTVHRMHVPPLSLAAVSELAGASDVDPVKLHQRTGGNPFFVVEVLAGNGAGVPDRAGDAVMARVARLSHDAAEVLEMLSLSTHGAAPGLVNGLVDNGDALDECVAAGLLESRAGHLVFRHDIAREAVAGSVSPGKRQAVHAKLLAALEAGSVPASTLAYHAAQAGDAAAVLKYAPVAGRRAMQLHSYREAGLQFARAVPYAEDLPVEQRAQLFEDLGWVSFMTDDMESALSSRRRAVELWAVAGRAAAQLRNLTHLADRLYHVSERRQAEAAAAQALCIADALPPGTPERADAYALQAILSVGKSGSKEALAWASKAATSARLTENHRALAVSHYVSGFAHSVDSSIARARREMRAGIATAAANGLHDLVADLNLDAGSVLASTHRFEAADRFYAEAVSVSQDRDFDCSLNHSVAHRGASHLYQGRWREAAEDSVWVLERPSASSAPRSRALTTLGLLRARRGDPEAMEALDEALTLATSPLAVADVTLARLEAAHLLGGPSTAVAEGEELYRSFSLQNYPWQTTALAYRLWMAAIDPALPPETQGPYAWQVRAMPSAAARRWRRLGCPYEQAVALTECDAVPQLMEAFEIFQRLGARPLWTKTAERLRQLGARGIPRGPRETTKSHPAGLTTRERQVLRLLEKGLRNTEIAARNRVSRRTVENQVSAVLSKLGVRTRTEAVVEAHRRGWISVSDSPGTEAASNSQ